MREPTLSWMLVVVRHPIGAGVSLVGLLALLAFVLSMLDDGAGGVHDGNRRVREIRASSATLIASDLAGFQERMRREGRGYARDTDALISAWLEQFPRRDRREMRDWTGYHGVQASATSSGFVIETMSAPEADGWYRLEVERNAGRISATCGGSPAPGCVGGRWRIQAHGLPASYLLRR
jgi:hypothetical protein